MASFLEIDQIECKVKNSAPETANLGLLKLNDLFGFDPIEFDSAARRIRDIPQGNYGLKHIVTANVMYLFPDWFFHKDMAEAMRKRGIEEQLLCAGDIEGRQIGGLFRRRMWGISTSLAGNNVSPDIKLNPAASLRYLSTVLAVKSRQWFEFSDSLK